MSGCFEHGVVLDREGLTLPSVLVLLLVLALGRSEKEDDDEDEHDCRSAEPEAAIPRRPVFRVSTRLPISSLTERMLEKR